MVLIAWYGNWELPWSHNPAEFPSTWKLVKGTLVCAFTEDFLFYVSHRAFHCKDKRLPLYQWFHKMHHEYSKPICIASEYAHPVENLFCNTMPTLTPCLILGKKMHYYQAVHWLTIRIYETHEGHSGYEFPWSPFRLIPFGNDATYHDYHHSKNFGNYASLMSIWDTLFDTNKDYYEGQIINAKLKSE